ncbi:MAG: CPBP family intramembrane metalloprotease [Chloroflexi bacterium]|nr:MAG: CPBP family intramembrane metalloprotease [Chloroflexota bacterium]
MLAARGRFDRRRCLGEEIFWRGFLFERLGALFGSTAGARIAIVAITSIAFALAHRWGISSEDASRSRAAKSASSSCAAIRRLRMPCVPCDLESSNSVASGLHVLADRRASMA